MTNIKRLELIIKSMKVLGIELWRGITNKKYDNKEVYELIDIANCFPELREKNKKEFYFY